MTIQTSVIDAVVYGVGLSVIGVVFLAGIYQIIRGFVNVRKVVKQSKVSESKKKHPAGKIEGWESLPKTEVNELFKENN